MRSRITFETDAENDYFGRDTETGQFSLFIVNGEHRIPVTDYVGPNLQNGIGTLSVQFPLNCQVGDGSHFLAVVTDSSRVDPFENSFVVKVRPAAQPTGSPRQRRKPPAGETGDDREVAAGIALPNITEVYEKDWDKQTPPSTNTPRSASRTRGPTRTAGMATRSRSTTSTSTWTTSTSIRRSSRSTATPRSSTRGSPTAWCCWGWRWSSRTRWRRRKPRQRSPAKTMREEQEKEETEVNIEKRVAEFTQAVAPVLLPMIESLGDLDEDQIPSVVGSGGAT